MSTAVVKPETVQRTLPVCLPPWLENPYRPLTWWDVHNFSGQDLQSAISILERMRCEWLHANPAGDPVAARMLGQRVMLGGGQREQLEGYLRTVETMVKNSGLPVSGEALFELRNDLLAYRLEGFETLSAEQFVARLEEVQRTIRREMQSIVFLYIHSPEAGIYSNPLVGWEAVAAKWPMIALDISESARCLALDRFAAAIFHVLLVAEYGVIQVTDLLNVSGDKPGWGGIQRLEKILQRPYKDRTQLEQAHSKLLADIVPMMVAVKDSSRHKISHVDNRLIWLDRDFGPVVANEVVAAVRGFMRRLATELP